MGINRKRRRLTLDSLRRADEAIKNSRWNEAWDGLIEAHILGQPDPWLHFFVHWKMLVVGFKQRDVREISGQFFRMMVAAPGSLLGVYPVGNTGRSDVGAFQKMAIPGRLADKISEAVDES